MNFTFAKADKSLSSHFQSHTPSLMKRILFLAFASGLLFSCQNDVKPIENSIAVTYTQTKKVDTVDTYFGTDVPDPYRWLEDDRSDETKDWVKRQNQVTYGYLDTMPFREELKDRLEKLWNYEKIGSPFKEGDYTYFYKNNGE